MARPRTTAILLTLVLSITGICGRLHSPEALARVSGTETISTDVAIATSDASLEGPLDTACDFCKQTATQMHDFLVDPNSSATAVDLIEAMVCQGLPGALGDQCATFVEEFVPSSFVRLSAEIGSGTCVQAGVCPAAHGQLALKASPSRSSEPKCEACKNAMESLLILVNDPKTQGAILEKLQQTCLRFKQKALQEKCDLLVEVYFQQLVEILKGVTPGEICDAIKACNASTMKRTMRAVAAVARKAHVALQEQAQGLLSLVQQGSWAAVQTYNPQECVACRLLVQLMKKRLEEPKNQARVEEFLLDYCTYAGSHVQECKDAVVKYLPAILANVDSFIDPKKVCEKAKICVPFPPFSRVSAGDEEDVLRLPSQRVLLV